MKLKLLGTLVGVAMLALAAPVGAATVSGTSVVNSAGNPPLSFSATDLTNGVQGVNGADFDDGKRYYDYIYSFTLSSAAEVIAGATATAGTNVLESHLALFSGSPANTDLDVGHNPGPLTSLTDTGDLLSETSHGPANSFLNTLTTNLAAGTYFLRIFGVIAGNSDPNSHLVALSGTITATPIPAALPLFASALGLVGFMGWRRKSAATAAAA